jgi:hypothetical protein
LQGGQDDRPVRGSILRGAHADLALDALGDHDV